MGAECSWDESARELPPDFMRDVLGKMVQGQVWRVVGDRADAAFLAASVADTLQGRGDRAHMCSASGGAVSVWLETTPACHRTGLVHARVCLWRSAPQAGHRCRAHQVQRHQVQPH